MGFRNLLFDLDGTLLNTAPGIMWSLRRCFEEMGLPEKTDEQLRAFIGPPLYESFETYCGLTGEENQRAVRTYQKYFNEYGGRDMIEPYQGMEQLLHRLQDEKNEDGSAKYRLFVATTKPETVASQVLKDCGYASCFELIGGALKDNKGSQKVDVIKRVMKNSGLITECVEAGEVPYQSEAAKRVIAESLMIGDRFYDIRGAHYVGMRAAAVAWGFGSETEFKEWEADYLLSSPEDLYRVLEDSKEKTDEKQ